MGQAINSIANEHDFEITIPIDINDDPNERMNECDVVIDFSLHDATPFSWRQQPIKAYGLGQQVIVNQIGIKLLLRLNQSPLFGQEIFQQEKSALLSYSKASKVLDENSDFDPEVIECTIA